MNSGRRIKSWEIDEIVDKKMVNGKERYLVKWRRFSELNTWELAENFSSPDIIQQFEETRVIQDRRSNIRSSVVRPERRLNESQTSVVTKSKIPAFKTFRTQKSSALCSTPGTEKVKKFVNLMKSELQCSICCDLFQEASVTNCGHIFCAGCIKQWKHRSYSCPICRGVLMGERKVTELNNFIEKASNLFDKKK